MIIRLQCVYDHTNESASNCGPTLSRCSNAFDALFGLSLYDL